MYVGHSQKIHRIKLSKKKKTVVWFSSNIANVAENAEVFLRQRTVWPNRERKMSDVYIIPQLSAEKSENNILPNYINDVRMCRSNR